MENKSVDLGYLEIPEQSWILHRCYFPSKVGGKPAWLNPDILPSFETLQCRLCNKQMIFFMQLYAPNEEKPNSFHRTIYIFGCKNGGCYKSQDCCPIKVLRCNLPRDNVYYSSEPPDYSTSTAAESSKDIPSLCVVCGCVGKKFCSRCKAINYCGKEHQVIDWKAHKPICGNTASLTTSKVNKNYFLFPEFELVIERESGSSPRLSESIQSTVTIDSQTTNAFSEEELKQNVNTELEDKRFMKFKDVISNEPEQVVRYKKNGSPLWCSSLCQLKPEDIPPCQCGSSRAFEFQIMPHLLSHLNVDTAVEEATIDWGTIIVYTCSSDCSQTDSYTNEFAWRQAYTE